MNALVNRLALGSAATPASLRGLLLFNPTSSLGRRANRLQMKDGNRAPARGSDV